MGVHEVSTGACMGTAAVGKHRQGEPIIRTSIRDLFTPVSFRHPAPWSSSEEVFLPHDPSQGSWESREWGYHAGSHPSEVEVRLDYMFARYYSSGLGRFLAVDPGNDTVLGDPQSWNKYAYVRNNPVAYLDPNGRSMTSPQNAGDRKFTREHPIAALAVSHITSRVKGEVKKEFGIKKGDIPDNTPANAVQHATMACEFSCSSLIGEDLAAELLSSHEFFDAISCDEEKAMDMHNNRKGVEAARNEASCASCIDTSMGLLRDNDLQTSPNAPASNRSEDGEGHMDGDARMPLTAKEKHKRDMEAARN